MANVCYVLALMGACSGETHHGSLVERQTSVLSLRDHQRLALYVNVGAWGHGQLRACGIESDGILTGIRKDFSSKASKIAIDGGHEPCALSVSFNERHDAIRSSASFSQKSHARKPESTLANCLNVSSPRLQSSVEPSMRSGRD